MTKKWKKTTRFPQSPYPVGEGRGFRVSSPMLTKATSGSCVINASVRCMPFFGYQFSFLQYITLETKTERLNISRGVGSRKHKLVCEPLRSLCLEPAPMGPPHGTVWIPTSVEPGSEFAKFPSRTFVRTIIHELFPLLFSKMFASFLANLFANSLRK